MRHSVPLCCARCGESVTPDEKRHKIDDLWVCHNCWVAFADWWKDD